MKSFESFDQTKISKRLQMIGEYNEVINGTDLTTINNGMTKPQKEQRTQNFLNGLNKMQELRLLSKEDSRIKNHLSNLLESMVCLEPESELYIN